MNLLIDIINDITVSLKNETTERIDTKGFKIRGSRNL